MSTQTPICQQCQQANKHGYHNTSQGWVCDDCEDTVSEAELSERLTNVEIKCKSKNPVRTIERAVEMFDLISSKS